MDLNNNKFSEKENLSKPQDFCGESGKTELDDLDLNKNENAWVLQHAGWETGVNQSKGRLDTTPELDGKKRGKTPLTGKNYRKRKVQETNV